MSDAIGTVSAAEQLDRLPRTAAAVRRGELSPDQAKAVIGAAAVDPTAEGRLLDHAGQGSLDELRNECKRVRGAGRPRPGGHPPAHPQGASRAQPHRCRRHLGDDGPGHHGVGRAHPCGLRHRADGIFRQAHRAGRREPSEAYLFDALEQMCTDPGAAEGATALPKGANAKVIVRIDWPALVRGRTVDGEVCEIAGVGPVPVSVVRELCEDAFVAVVLTKGADICSVTHLGRRHTALQVTALQWRDPECARLGCANTIGLENDHRADWAHTHVTRVDQSRPALPPRPQAQDRTRLDARRRHRQTPTPPTRPPRPPTPQDRPRPNARVRSGPTGLTPADPGQAAGDRDQPEQSVAEVGHDLADEAPRSGLGAGLGPAADEVAVAGVAPLAGVLAGGVEVVERERGGPHDRRRVTAGLGGQLVDALVGLLAASWACPRSARRRRSGRRGAGSASGRRRRSRSAGAGVCTGGGRSWASVSDTALPS